MDYLKIRKKPDQFVNLTSLTKDEFDKFQTTFEEEWDKFIKYHRLDGSIRKNKVYVHKNSQLPSTPHKLFFILYYLRNHPAQTALAASFGMEQYQANQWIHRLTGILESSLYSLGMLPVRDMEELQKVIDNNQISRLLIDATEREVYRSTDYETQKEHYSGKKKSIQ